MTILTTRMQRLRQKPNLRKLVQDVSLSINDLIYPLFIKEHLNEKKAIASMPGQYQLSLKDLPEEMDIIAHLNIPAVILFGIPQIKDTTGEKACSESSIITQAIHTIKKHHPELIVITDLCFCEYTSHGHCGVLDNNNRIDNDSTLKQLQKQALCHAKAGADIIAPSGMMDGMVKYIREALDNAEFHLLPILSYAVKYHSFFYGPFRDAAEGSPQFGDRSHYQMDFYKRNEALREASLDIDEGADMLMVKPAMNYLDIIYQLKQAYPAIPLGGYQVSGEYAMIKAAADKGYIDEKNVVMESLIAMKRAGCDFIISYFAKDIAKNL